MKIMSFFGSHPHPVGYDYKLQLTQSVKKKKKLSVPENSNCLPSKLNSTARNFVKEELFSRFYLIFSTIYAVSWKRTKLIPKVHYDNFCFICNFQDIVEDKKNAHCLEFFKSVVSGIPMPFC